VVWVPELPPLTAETSSAMAAAPAAVWVLAAALSQQVPPPEPDLRAAGRTRSRRLALAGGPPNLLLQDARATARSPLVAWVAALSLQGPVQAQVTRAQTLTQRQARRLRQPPSPLRISASAARWRRTRPRATCTTACSSSGANPRRRAYLRGIGTSTCLRVRAAGRVATACASDCPAMCSAELRASADWCIMV
jgi:hypothetical protein